MDPDIKKEYENQRKYLETSKNSLKMKLEKESQIHKEDHRNIMTENVKLIKSITDLRSKVKELKSMEKNRRTELKMRKSQHEQQIKNKQNGENISQSMGGSAGLQSGEQDEMQKQDIRLKKELIDSLRLRLKDSQQENNFL